MSEKKFRAWDLKDKKMIDMSYPTYSAAPNCDRNILDIIWFFNCLNGLDGPKQGRYILMQYVGLKDKNDIKIYEGDILELGKTRTMVAFKEGQFVGVNKGRGGYFIFKDPTEKRRSLWCFNHKDYPNKTEWKIIGNIHQNKDLLK